MLGTINDLVKEDKMKLQKTLLASLVAAACVAGAAPAFAAPAFSTGTNVAGDTALNDIELVNRENLYRTDAACAAGGCLGANPGNPAGYQRVVSGAVVQPGDLFIGILNLRVVSNTDTGTTWSADSTAPGIDEFSGYFIQEVKSVADISANTKRILLGGASVADPFGILNTKGADGIYGTSDDIGVGLWVDDAGGPQTAVKLDGLFTTAAQSIASATDGDLWAYLGFGADNTGTAAAPNIDTDGYAYSEFDTTAANFTGNFFVAYEIVEEGAAYNAGRINAVNDPAELAVGGGLLGDPTTTAINNYFGVCVPTATYACNDIAGNGQLSANQNLSPWMFASEDPLQFNAIPEPGTLGLLGLGLLGLSASLRRRTK